jgi:hypothetical protein
MTMTMMMMLTMSYSSVAQEPTPCEGDQGAYGNIVPTQTLPLPICDEALRKVYIFQ